MHILQHCSFLVIMEEKSVFDVLFLSRGYYYYLFIFFLFIYSSIQYTLVVVSPPFIPPCYPYLWLFNSLLIFCSKHPRVFGVGVVLCMCHLDGLQCCDLDWFVAFCIVPTVEKFPWGGVTKQACKQDGEGQETPTLHKELKITKGCRE